MNETGSYKKLFKKLSNIIFELVLIADLTYINNNLNHI